MGIYIPGMKMPDCGYRTVEITFDADGYPMALADGGDAFDIIPVPLHGRLGDLDALERNLREMADYQHGDRQQGILGCCNTICSAHTIIPADPEEGANR